MSKRNNKRSAELSTFGVIAWGLAILAAAVGIVLLCTRISASDPATDDQNSTAPATTGPVVKIEDLKDSESEEYRGLQVEKVGSYSGLYVEDGTDDVLSRILMVIVKNTGSRTVQYAEVELTDGTKTAYFTLSTLPPGESVVLLEKNRMSYADGKDLTQTTIKNVAVFALEPDLCEDRIKVQALDGVLNVTNISGKDIEGNVVIYYKNAASDLLYGGITYRSTITGGIKAGETKQIVASHYSQKGSRILWITVD